MLSKKVSIILRLSLVTFTVILLATGTAVGQENNSV
jgi:hypothetical protein